MADAQFNRKVDQSNKVTYYFGNFFIGLFSAFSSLMIECAASKNICELQARPMQ